MELVQRKEKRKQPVVLAQRQRKQHVELAQRQAKKSSLWNWPRESSLWNWPRDRGEKAARDQPEERKQPVCKSSNYIPTCAFRKFIRE